MLKKIPVLFIVLIFVLLSLSAKIYLAQLLSFSASFELVWYVIHGVLLDTLVLFAFYILFSLRVSKLTSAFLSLTYIFLCLLIIADVVYFYYTYEHIQAVVFANFNLAAIQRAIYTIPIYQMVFTLLCLPIVFILLYKYVIRNLSPVSKAHYYTFLAALVVILVLNLSLNKFEKHQIATVENPNAMNKELEQKIIQDKHTNLNLINVSSFLNLLDEGFIYASNIKTDVSTEPFVAYTAKEANWLEDKGFRYQPEDNCKAQSQEKNFPYKKIVMIVFESLHAEFIHFYNQKNIPAGTTPFLDSLLSQYPHMDNYYTSAMPTSRGLNAMFMSQLEYWSQFSAQYHHDTLFSLAKQHYDMDSLLIRGITEHYEDELRQFKSAFKLGGLWGKETLEKKYPLPFFWGFNNDAVYQEGLDFLAKNPDKPQFLILKTLDLHQPAPFAGNKSDTFPEAIKNHPEPTIKALHWADSLLADLFQQLHQQQLMDDTLFIITADHVPFGGRAHQTLVNREKKHYMGRLPLIFVAKDLSPFANLDQSQYASQIDLAPTLLDLMGIDCPPYYLGRSLLQPSEKNAAISYAIRKANYLLYTSQNDSFTVMLNEGNPAQQFESNTLRKWMLNQFSLEWLTN